MTTHQKHHFPISVLNKLENAIRQKIPRHVHVVDELSDLLHLSRESIYRRLRGSTAFSLEEIWLIFKTYQVSIDEWFEGLESNRINLAFYSVGTLNPLQYCDCLHRWHLEALNHGVEWYSISAHIPMFYLLQQPHLTNFKVLLWNHRYGCSDQPTSIPIQWQELWTKMSHTVVRHEVWPTHAAKQILQELSYAISCGLVFDSSFLWSFFKELIHVIKTMFEPSNDNLMLYQQEVYGSLTIQLIVGNMDSMMVCFDDDMVGISTGKHVSTYPKASIQSTLKQSIKITGQSERLKGQFYRALLEPIFTSAKDLLEKDQVETLKGIV